MDLAALQEKYDLDIDLDDDIEEIDFSEKVICVSYNMLRLNDMHANRFTLSFHCYAVRRTEFS